MFFELDDKRFINLSVAREVVFNEKDITVYFFDELYVRIDGEAKGRFADFWKKVVKPHCKDKKPNQAGAVGDYGDS